MVQAHSAVSSSAENHETVVASVVAQADVVQPNDPPAFATCATQTEESDQDLEASANDEIRYWKRLEKSGHEKEN
jgi:hypothetical protein